MEALSVQTSVISAGIPVIYDAHRLIKARTVLTKVARAGISVIAILRSMHAGAIHALVGGAGVPVIQNTRRNIEAGTILAEILRARIDIVTVSLNVHALPVHAIIVRTGISVIHDAYRLINTIASLTEIIGAGIAVITHHWCPYALPVHALVNRAGIVISAIARSEHTTAVYAGIRGAGVLVVANNSLIDALPVDLTKIFGARIVVLTGIAVGTSALALINSAGVAIGACKRHISRIGTALKVGSDNVIISQ